MLENLELEVETECRKVPKQVEEYKKSFSKGNHPRVKPDTVPSLNLGISKDDLSLPEAIGSDWAALTIANAIEYEEGKVNHKAKEKSKRAVMKNGIDSQVSENAKRAKAYNDQLLKERREKEKEFSDWQMSETQKAEKAKIKNNELRVLFHSQLESKRLDKQNEKQRLKDESMAEARNLKEQMIRADQSAAAVKREEKSRYQDMIAESAKNEIVKQRLKLKTDEEEKLIVKQYKERLDKEDRAKAALLESRTKKFESIGKNFMETGAGKQKMEAEKKIERIVAKEAKLKEDRDDLRNKRDIDKLHQDKLLMKKFNTMLINEKAEREEKEKKMEEGFVNKQGERMKPFSQQTKLRKRKEKVTT